mmetsp:Transcript_11827/g.13011  ORF Transcript_11827/g.13011 Transcript_11827/m.13011 type:complete len:112 (+) Transcript_11827:49-384(+)
MSDKIQHEFESPRATLHIYGDAGKVKSVVVELIDADYRPHNYITNDIKIEGAKPPTADAVWSVLSDKAKIVKIAGVKDDGTVLDPPVALPDKLGVFGSDWHFILSPDARLR